MIDIIIPAYNARDTLPALLDSLVAQTKKMFITTVVDDCSTESYDDIIETYKERGLKIRCIRTPENGGPGMARQYGMDNDQMSKYFMFADADDLYLPHAVQVLSHEIQTNDCDIVTSYFLREEEGKTMVVAGSDTNRTTWFHGKIYKADYLRENNIRFHPELRLNEDAYFNAVAMNASENIRDLPIPTYIWSYNKKSLTRCGTEADFFVKGWEGYCKSQIYALEKLLELKGELKIPFTAFTLMNVYCQCAEAQYHGLDYSYLKDKFANLREIGILHEIAKDESFWSTIMRNLHAGNVRDNIFIFYKLRFVDWFTQIVEGREVEDGENILS